jgi:uncharacterized protein with FMN-binding domain
MKDRTRKRIAAAAVASALGLAMSAMAGAQAKATSLAAGNGTFTGSRQYAYYGWVRVSAVVESGVVQDIKVLEYPDDNGTSQNINSVALPHLIQETVGGSTARVDLISGATFTSAAYVKSLQDALKQAGL